MPVTQTASERLAKLRQAADMLGRAQQLLTTIGDPPRCDFRSLVLDANAQTIGAIDQWMVHEQDKLA